MAPPRLFRGWARWIVTRRALRALDRIADRLDRQNGYLQRLADHYAPEPPTEPDPDDLRRTRSVDFADDQDLVQVLAYQATQRALGHEPTDDEILAALEEARG